MKNNDAQPITLKELRKIVNMEHWSSDLLVYIAAPDEGRLVGRAGLSVLQPNVRPLTHDSLQLVFGLAVDGENGKKITALVVR